MQTISIGREPGNQVLITDPLVSRRHAELVVLDNGQVIVKDLSSSNGTFVNGNRISESYLKPGDIVKCASAFLNWQQYLPAINNLIQQPATNNEQPQPAAPATPAFAEHNMVKPPQFVQQNVIVMGKAKSVGAAFILAFIFGPFGLLYVTIIGGIFMSVVWIAVAIYTFGLGLILVHFICAIWALIAANLANSALQGKASGMINNNFQN